MTAPLVLLGVLLAGGALWWWLAHGRVPNRTLPSPLPEGFRVELIPRESRLWRSPNPVAVVVSDALSTEQARTPGDAGRWIERRWSHPRERRIYAQASDPEVAARFAVRWFHAYHARLDEAEAAMAAWSGPEGPLPLGLRMKVEVIPGTAERERGGFAASITVDRSVPTHEHDLTRGTGVDGLPPGDRAYSSARLGRTAEAAAIEAHRAFAAWQEQTRSAAALAARWS